MSLEKIRTEINISNLCWWIIYGGLSMDGKKWCKHLGFVSVDFDCDGCKQCEGKAP